MTDIVSVPSGPPWDDGRWVAERLKAAGFAAWFVGGCVRDLLLDRAVKDVDVATDAVPERVEALFERTVAVGRSFGVVVVVTPSGANVEVATFRHDGRYLDGRRPESVTYGTAEEDVARRDFTVNALLLDPGGGTVVDHVGGLPDLRARVLRAVGDASARLREDRLRVLRALRFAAALGLEIEPATWAAIRDTPLTGLSGERLVQEWFKALGGDRRGAWLGLLADSGRLAEFCAPLADAGPEAVAVTAAALDRLPADAPRGAQAATWLHRADPAAAQAWLAALPLERTVLRDGVAILDALRGLPGFPARPTAERRRAALDPLAPAVALTAAATSPGSAGERAFAAAHAAEASGTAHRPLLRASDLIGLGLAPGPRLGALLRQVEDAQLAGEVVDKDAALAWARRRIDAPSEAG